MSTVTLKHFNTLDYVEKAEKLGIPNEIAKFQARQIEQVVEIQNQAIQEQSAKLTALESTDIATKGDVRESELRLQREIANIEARLIKWIFGVGISAVILLSGSMFTMFKLMTH